ncbi:MAG: hypothetical protein JWO10_667 [Microbacteriaceae bacterium]|nr:hypothetical protein [Microbacteriaceae bacterium]
MTAVLFAAEGQPGRFAQVADEAAAASVAEALALARRLAAAGAVPGSGSTRDLWEALATVAAHDVGAARALEPHLDAVAILDQAGMADRAGEGTWGVFAAEGTPVLASHVVAIQPVSAAGDWQLDGTKSWCSLAASLDSALISATTDDGSRMLFAVSLQQPGVEVLEGTWHARGLAEIPSGPVRLHAASATAVGDSGWYLHRPGFSWGGIGVAACWYGGAVGVARALYTAARQSPEDVYLAMHLGAVDELLQSCRRALLEASAAVDDGWASGDDGRLLARRVRATVAWASDDVIARVGRALGPAPLALDEAHAKRVADLSLYLRQHHAEKDDASLGRSLAARETAPW